MWSIPIQRKFIFARAEAVGRELAKKDYDMVLFQEVFTNAVRTTLLYHIGRGYEDRYQRAPFARMNSGLFNLSKFKITKTSFMPFYSCRGIQCGSKKGILYMQVRLPQGELVDVFNLHTQAYTESSDIRVSQLEQLRKFIELRNDGSIPVVLLGDFNVDGNGPEYGVFQKYLYDFKDVWNEAAPNQPGFTWDPFNNYWAQEAVEDNLGESIVPERLDYIWIRDGKKHRWKIKDVKVVFDQELPWWGSGDYPKYILASDHYGVEASLELGPILK